MINPVQNINMLAFKAIYRENDEKCSDMQRVVAHELANNLYNSPKDAFERNLPMIMEDDYGADINLKPAADENSIHVSVSNKDATFPIGIYDLNNAKDIVDDIDEMYPYYVNSKKSNNIVGGIATFVLTLGAVLITLMGAAKCSTSNTVKTAEKVAVETKAQLNNIKTVAKDTLKMFK